MNLKGKGRVSLLVKIQIILISLCVKVKEYIKHKIFEYLRKLLRFLKRNTITTICPVLITVPAHKHSVNYE